MKNILIITSSFAPENRIGAVRTTKIAKYLVRMGLKVTIITTELLEKNIIDKTLISPELDEMEIFRIPMNKSLLRIRNQMLKNKSASSYVVQNNKSSIIKKIIISYGFKIYRLIQSAIWKKKALNLINNKLRNRYFNVILSSYPKTYTHSLASDLVKKNPSSLWIADFRDPMAYQSINSKQDYLRNDRLQKHFCRNANLVTYVSEKMLKKISYDDIDKSKYHFLPNGFDTDDSKYIQQLEIEFQLDKDNIFIITYAGSLYGGKRDLSILFKTIRKLIDTDIIDENKIRFIYAGKDFNVLTNQANQYKLVNILKNEGSLSREESLYIQSRSNLVIVNTWNTEKDQGVVPGKVYECFLLKKPTLAIINGTVPSSELGNMIINAGLGIAVDTMKNNHITEQVLDDFLIRLYDSAINNTEYKQMINTEYISQFNYKNITDTLIEIIEDFQM